MTQIQPTLTFSDRRVPSFTIKLLINEIKKRYPDLKVSGIVPVLKDLGEKVLDSEQAYAMEAVDRIAEERQFRYQDQLDVRLDTLDTFLEGLTFGRDEPLNPQEVFGELRELTRTRLELNPQQIRELTDGASPELVEELSSQIETQLQSLELRRLIGAAERLLGSSLEVEDDQLADLDWESAPEWILNLIEEQFKERKERYFSDPEEALVIKSIQVGLKDVEGDRLTESDLVKILGLMAEGRQAAFDKKSHKRIWLRTQRIRYPFYAAELLMSYPQEQIADADLDIGDLPPDLESKEQDLMGRSVLSNIYRDLFLRVISELWVEYLTEMEALRVAIGLEAYAQRDPLVQYKTRGFEMFQRLMADMRLGVVNRMFTFQPRNLDRIQAGVENT
ncbi:MAG: hypothetical protein P8Y37_05465 [Anaerolineales bacterium]